MYLHLSAPVDECRHVAGPHPGADLEAQEGNDMYIYIYIYTYVS